MPRRLQFSGSTSKSESISLQPRISPVRRHSPQNALPGSHLSWECSGNNARTYRNGTVLPSCSQRRSISRKSASTVTFHVGVISLYYEKAAAIEKMIWSRPGTKIVTVDKAEKW